jgi:hypothetical protein
VTPDDPIEIGVGSPSTTTTGFFPAATVYARLTSTSTIKNWPTRSDTLNPPTAESAGKLWRPHGVPATGLGRSTLSGLPQACNGEILPTSVTSSVPAGDMSGRGHAHHWLIQGQDGPSSDAVCKGCGERRTFLNDFKRLKPTWMRPRISPDKDPA